MNGKFLLRYLFSFVFVSAFIFGVIPVASAATLFNVTISTDTVADDGFCSLREAVTSANSGVDSGATSGECLAAGGPYTIHLPSNLTYDVSTGGQLVINNGTNLTISGDSGQEINTIIDGATTVNIFSVSAGGIFALNSVTLTNGHNTFVGGAIIFYGTSLNVDHVIFTGNDAVSGGGAIYLDTGTILITNSSFTGNSALSGTNGGAILVSNAALTINNSSFTNNSIPSGQGGAVYTNGGLLTIDNSIFSSNVTLPNGYGGALYARTSASLVMNTSIFDGNTSAYGGAIVVDGPSTINKSLLINNVSLYVGGGIFAQGDLTITNSTLFGNSTGNHGGGICALSSDLVMKNDTLSGNSGGGSNGGAMSVAFATSAESSNSIFINSPTGNNCNGTFGIEDNNLEFPGTSCGFANNNVTTDPQLEPLANNGGFSQTMAIPANSSAKDAGNDATCSSVDQRNQTRAGNGAHCDIGAYEYLIPPPVLTLITPVTPTSTTNSSPDYTFSSTEAGTISYGGTTGCTSATTSILANTSTQIQFGPNLTDNVYACTITVTGTTSGLSSNVLTSNFTVDTTAPVLTAVAEVSPNPTSNTSPAYSFSSTEEGTISYASCPTVTSPAASSTVANGATTGSPVTVVVTFGPLSSNMYSGCTITVTDVLGNVSSNLVVQPFTIDTVSSALTAVAEVSPNPTSNASPTYSFSTTEAGTISYAGCPTITSPAASSTVANGATVGNPVTVVVTFGPLSSGTYSGCVIGFVDGLNNPASTITVQSFTVDTVAPVLIAVTEVNPNPTSNVSPTYSFSSTEAGTISYAGCPTVTSPATSSTVANGATTGSPVTVVVTFGPLSSNTYSGCTITVTDVLGNASSALTVQSFRIDTVAPVLAAVAQVSPNPTSNVSPTYSFSSTEEGTISYAGCPTITSPAASSTVANGATTGSPVTVVVTFGPLNSNTYSGCAITVTDVVGNISSAVTVQSFMIDAIAPVLTAVTEVNPNPTTNVSPTYSFSSTEEGTISYAGCPTITSPAASSTVANGATTGSPVTVVVTFGPLSSNTYSGCSISVTDAVGNVSPAVTVQSFIVSPIIPPDPVNPSVTPPPGLFSSSNSISGSGCGGCGSLDSPENPEPNPVPVNNFQGYKDLGKTDVNYKAFEYVYNKDIVTGNPDGSVDPTGKLQRDQIAKIILKTFHTDFDANNDYCNKISPFPDVAVSSWSAHYICYGLQKKLITGYLSGVDKGYYRPERFVSWAEFAVLVTRNLKDVPSIYSSSYPGVVSGEWYSGAAKYFYDHKLSSTFNPGKIMTRREVVEVLYKLSLEE